MKCYNASFNVGKVEVWSSELYLKKKSVLEEIEESIEEIAEQILEEDDILHSQEEINKAILKMLKHGFYQKDNFDFFILEQYVWKDMQDRETFTKNMKL